MATSGLVGETIRTYDHALRIVRRFRWELGRFPNTCMVCAGSKITTIMHATSMQIIETDRQIIKCTEFIFKIVAHIRILIFEFADFKNYSRSRSRDPIMHPGRSTVTMMMATVM